MILLILILYLATVHTQETKPYSSKTIAAENQNNCSLFGQCEALYNQTEPYKLNVPDNSWSLVKYIEDFVFGVPTSEDLEIISRTKNYLNTEKELSAENGIEFDLRKREDSYTKTDPKDFPYTVSLIIAGGNGTLEPNTRSSFCTGSLLTAEWVLTAEHCVKDKKGRKIYVYAGGNSALEVLVGLLNSIPLPNTSQLIISETIFTDEQGYDIALIKLPEKFNLTDTVNTIQLASEPWTHHGYRTCVTTAFGGVYMKRRHGDDFSRKTHELEVKNPCLCNYYMKHEFAYERPGTLGAQEIVCSKPRIDYGVCGGDYGGGLICDGLLVAVNMLLIEFQDVAYCEINLVGRFIHGSSKPRCGSKDTLSVFQLVCPSLSWINSHVKLFNKTSECWNLKSVGTIVSFRYWTIATGMLLQFVTV